MRPHDERQEAYGEYRIDHRAVAPNGLARVAGDDFGHDPHARQYQHIHFRMPQKPEQMLPQQRAAPAADVQVLARHDQARREEKAGVQQIVPQLQDGRGFQWRKGQQKKEAGDKLRPHEERQPHPRQSLGAHLNNGRDEVDGSQQGRTDQEHHADYPKRLPVGSRPHVRHRRQRRIRGPARLRGPARNEEAGQHDDPAHEIELVADHVDARKRHVRRADLERSDKVAERPEGQRHNGQKHHDRPVHGPEGIVEARHHHPDMARRILADHVLAEHPEKQLADNRDGMAGISQLPAHHRHQAEPHEQKHQPGDAVLEADDFVVGGKDVLLPETRLLVGRGVSVVRCRFHVCLFFVQDHEG